MRQPRYAPLKLPEDFERALDRRPADWDLRAVIADWLDDNGDTLGAECLRWQARAGRRPQRYWDCWVIALARVCGRGRTRRCEIPAPLWDRLPPRVQWFTGVRVYDTRA